MLFKGFQLVIAIVQLKTLFNTCVEIINSIITRLTLYVKKSIFGILNHQNGDLGIWCNEHLVILGTNSQ